MEQTNKQTNKQINSLQALRAVAFIGIFLSHAGAKYNWPALGVSSFFVLSGFLLVNSYYKKEVEVSFENNFVFSIKRIKKLYMLHIITMIFAIIINFVAIIQNGIKLRSIIGLGVDTILNIFLLQSWYPSSGVNVSLNGVAWFLSVMLFLYFAFPYVLKKIKKYQKKRMWLVMTAVLLMQILACYIFIKVLGENSKTYVWFMYCCPIFRLGDFIVGCCIGGIYQDRRGRESSFAIGSALEVIATIITIIVYGWTKQEHMLVIGKAINNWTTVYIPLAGIWVYLFAINNGIITRCLNNKFFRFIGNISAYTFLIHYIITQFFSIIITSVGISVDTTEKIGVIVLEFVLTVGLSMVYIFVEKKLKGRYKQTVQ